MALQQKLAERQKLMSQLDQAKMQEQLNRAMTSLNTTVDQGAPSLDQVREKIEARYARAIGASELGGQTVEARMLEVQQMAMGSEAKSRLDTMRAELGIGATGELGAGVPTTAELGAGAAATGAPAAEETPAPASTEGAEG
jgi:phage shock protein A